MRKIKWENILTILFVGFAIYQTIYHLGLNGLYEGLVFEIIIHIMTIATMRYLVKDMRKNPSNWTW